ncbi:uncharacterized protein [Anoplolepis gracilipes]|uniref:uncharacterized protein n=1 Tax=Anoplolepis gracilipes TaxID=354296 RepID=UPI003BA13BC7
MRGLKLRVSKQNFKSYGRCAGRMKPYLLLFKFCGMFANQITEGQLKRCSKPFYGICIFWVSVYVLFTCFLFSNFLIFIHIEIRTIVELCKHLLGFISLIVNVIAAYSSQNHFGKLFDRLDSYDHEAARLKNERRDNLWIPRIAMILITVINILLMSVITQERSRDILFFMTISDICTIFMHIYGTLEKSLLLYLMLIRFKHLNEKIVPKISWNKSQHESRTIEVLNVQVMYSMLYDAQQVFNNIYSNPLLLWFANLMLHVLGNIRIFREKKPLIACAFVVPPFLQMFTLCTICHYTAEEANKIGCVINGGMTALVNAGQAMKKIEILTYFLDSPVSFDAAGFFTINLPLFQSIIATITTYFMILI